MDSQELPWTLGAMPRQKVTDLRDEIRKRGLDDRGNKEELVVRLKKHCQELRTRAMASSQQSAPPQAKCEPVPQEPVKQEPAELQILAPSDSEWEADASTPTKQRRESAAEDEMTPEKPAVDSSAARKIMAQMSEDNRALLVGKHIARTQPAVFCKILVSLVKEMEAEEARKAMLSKGLPCVMKQPIKTSNSGFPVASGGRQTRCAHTERQGRWHLGAFLPAALCARVCVACPCIIFSGCSRYKET